jgi:hypothetical protein
MWPSYVYLENREAGFNRFARNPSSGAYGIPQALPPTKMPFSAQAAGGSHAGPQLSWMFAYIKGRYGNPVNAAAHERRFNWYGKGLLDGIFTRPTLIGVGDRPERVNITPLGRRGSPAAVSVTYNINIAVPLNANRAAVGREVVHAIQEYERSSGNRWRR